MSMICEICKEEIRDNQLMIGNYHLRCGESKIKVFYATMNGSKYYDRDIDRIMDAVKQFIVSNGTLPEIVEFGECVFSEMAYRNLTEYLS